MNIKKVLSLAFAMLMLFSITACAGQDVYLFSTNGGSGLADTVNTITEKLNDTNVNENAFQLHRNDMETAPDEVSRWLGVLDLNL